MSTLKKAKTSNTTKKSRNSTKVRLPPIKTFREETYTDMFTLREMPIHEDYIRQFALEWILHAKEDEDMLTMNDFLVKKGMNRSSIQEWLKRSEDMRKAYAFILMVIGNRRERGMLKKQLDSQGVVKSMHLYDELWKESETWRAHLAAKVAGAGGGITLVEMEKFPSSDQVPLKKVEDNDE